MEFKGLAASVTAGSTGLVEFARQMAQLFSHSVPGKPRGNETTGHCRRGKLERETVSLWVKSGSVCLAHQRSLGPDSALHTEALSTSTHKVRPEASAGLPRIRGQPWLQCEALWQQQQQQLNKLGQALNNCHSLAPPPFCADNIILSL